MDSVRNPQLFLLAAEGNRWLSGVFDLFQDGVGFPSSLGTGSARSLPCRGIRVPVGLKLASRGAHRNGDQMNSLRRNRNKAREKVLFPGISSEGSRVVSFPCCRVTRPTFPPPAAISVTMEGTLSSQVPVKCSRGLQ